MIVVASTNLRARARLRATVACATAEAICFRNFLSLTSVAATSVALTALFLSNCVFELLDIGTSPSGPQLDLPQSAVCPNVARGGLQRRAKRATSASVRISQRP